jgi:Uma2 family endonuclease
VDIDLYHEPIPLPRGGVRFPFELRPPPGFQVDVLSTWPKVAGRLEYVGGRLLYLPPCGDRQGKVAASVVGILEPWGEAHPEFDVDSNEIGMVLAGEVRGADAAVWPRSEADEDTAGFRRAPPVLAVEIAGRDEGEAELRAKARWYLGHGVCAVWLLFPDVREVLVLGPTDERRYRSGERLAPDPKLPGLTPQVDRFFRQLR